MVWFIDEPERVSVIAPDGSSLFTADNDTNTSGSAHSILGSSFSFSTNSSALLFVTGSSMTTVRIPAPIS